MDYQFAMLIYRSTMTMQYSDTQHVVFAMITLPYKCKMCCSLWLELPTL